MNTLLFLLSLSYVEWLRQGYVSYVVKKIRLCVGQKDVYKD